MSDITGDGIVFDRQQDIPLVDSFLTFGQCVVHVRPIQTWEGHDFGFDWIRVKDSGIAGDVPYHRNIGKYNNQTNTNSTEGRFDVQSPPFRNLVRSYYPKDKNIVWKYESTHGDNDSSKLEKESRFRYYIPVMTLRNTRSASLNLFVDMDTSRPAPDRIDISTSGTGIFTLSALQINNPTSAAPYPLTISCNQDTKEEQYLLLEAVYIASNGQEKKRICGFAQILPNYRQRRLKVLFVRMDFTDNLGGIIEGKIDPNHIIYAERILNQAMVDLEHATIPYVMPDTSQHRRRVLRNFDGTEFTQERGIKGSVFAALYQHMQDLNILKRYKDHVIVVFLGADCRSGRGYSPGSTSSNSSNPTNISVQDSTGNLITYQSHAGGVVLMFGSTYLTEETLVHEILHAAGLHHSFDNASPYTYRGTLTDNIMDYSHNASPPIDRISTWQWQWQALWNYTDRVSQNINKEFEESVSAMNNGIPEPNFDHYFEELKERLKEREKQELEKIVGDMTKETDNIREELERRVKEKIKDKELQKSLKNAIKKYNEKRLL